MLELSGYTKKRIESEMLSTIPDTLDKRQGSIIQTAISPAAWYLEGLYMILDQIQHNAYADTAVGEALDYICAERGIRRKAATPAVRKGTFNVEIPKGSTFKTINGANSVIFSSGDFIGVESGQYVHELTCMTAGIIGNSYTGNILPITSVSGLTSALIGEIIIPGSDEEKDDSLKKRFMETFDAASFGGNIASYRSAILQIEGVGAVQVYPAHNGGGTVLCSILDSELTPAEPGLIEAVQSVICPPEHGESNPSANGYGMAPIGAVATITTATNLVLNITCNMQFSAGIQAGVEIYQTQIEERIQEYLDKVCQSWGNPIKGQKVEYAVSVYISRIVAAILEIPDVINVTDVKINGSSDDLILTETASLQQIPSLGTVIINGG